MTTSVFTFPRFLSSARVALALAAAVSLRAASETYPWPIATPESQGLSSAKLDAFRAGLAQRNTSALLIVSHDKIVYEWYAPNTTPTSQLGTASTAKALIGGVAAAVVLDDGLIKLDDVAAKFIPQWSTDPKKAKITVRELGSHTSGLDDAEVGDQPHDQLPGWKGEFWKTLPVPHDPFTLSRDVVPMNFSPGEKHSYSNPGIAMLGYALTAALKNSPQKDLRTLLRDRVMRKIGIPDEAWQCGYGKTFVVDGLPLVAAWGGGSFTARGNAQIGLLMLHEGEWNGQRVLSAASVHAVTVPNDLPGDVAIGWWSNQKGRFPELPRDLYYAAGAGHKVVVVIPSLQIVVVRNGTVLAPGGDAQRRYFFTPLAEALAKE